MLGAAALLCNRELPSSNLARMPAKWVSSLPSTWWGSDPNYTTSRRRNISVSMITRLQVEWSRKGGSILGMGQVGSTSPYGQDWLWCPLSFLFSEKFGALFLEHSTTGVWNRQPCFIHCQGQECVELNLPSRISLSGAVVNKITSLQLSFTSSDRTVVEGFFPQSLSFNKCLIIINLPVLRRQKVYFWV